MHSAPLGNVIQDDIIAVLRKMGISPDLLEEFPELPPELEGLLVYGSQARGDAVPGSDLDLLGLVAAPQSSVHSGDVNISYYTSEQLSTGIGTLFGAHLKRDSKIVWDSHDHLNSAIQNMGEVDTGRLFARAINMCRLFTTLENDLPKYLSGLLRQARYLFRSCLYAQAIADGDPCFSVRELAARHGKPKFASLLASNQQGEPIVSDLNECLSGLRRIIGDFPLSEHGSLEATVVNEWEHPSDILSMAFMALGAVAEGSDYAEVEKILL